MISENLSDIVVLKVMKRAAASTYRLAIKTMQCEKNLSLTFFF